LLVLVLFHIGVRLTSFNVKRAVRPYLIGVAGGPILEGSIIMPPAAAILSSHPPHSVLLHLVCYVCCSALKKSDGTFAPAHILADGRLERAGRATKQVSALQLAALAAFRFNALQIWTSCAAGGSFCLSPGRNRQRIQMKCVAGLL
jgi:hypothetical protein